MSDYTKITDFAVKDSLLTGNPLKLITGTAHDNEYNAIAVAIATKVDETSGTLTNGTLVNTALGTPPSGTLTNCTGLPLAGVTDSTTEALGVGSLELGHATDTTLTRASAGVVAIEGVNILTTATGAALAGSVSQAFSALSVDVGNADTTISRASAGTIAVEGVNVLTTATGAAIGGSTSQAFACSNLAFPASQSASADANTLDDYEEGTFTPTIDGTTAAGVGTYTAQLGTYTKIGNIVNFSIALVWTAHTGTGNMNISGLPFTSASGGFEYPVANLNSNLAITAGNYLQTFISTSSTQVFIRQVPTGGGASAVVPIDTAATLEVCGHYKV